MSNADQSSLSKKMANLLAQGAAMLDLSCPACDSILFRLKSEMVYCPNCNAEIKVIAKDEEIPEALEEYQNKQQELIRLKDSGKITEAQFQEQISNLKFPNLKQNKNQVKTQKDSKSNRDTDIDKKTIAKSSTNNIQRDSINLETDGRLQSDLKHLALERIFEMFAMLKDETQLDNITKIVNNIDKLMDIIKKSEELF